METRKTTIIAKTAGAFRTRTPLHRLPARRTERRIVELSGTLRPSGTRPTAGSNPQRIIFASARGRPLGKFGLVENVAHPLDAARRQNHRDDIEAHAVPLDAGAAGVVLRGAREVLALIGVHRAIGFAEIGGLAGFHFDEDQATVIPDHEVELAAAGGRAIVARHHGAAAAPEEAMRQVLAETPVIG